MSRPTRPLPRISQGAQATIGATDQDSVFSSLGTSSAGHTSASFAGKPASSGGNVLKLIQAAFESKLAHERRA